jgi:glycosyltransferase involved in cell wall biosynthesis
VRVVPDARFAWAGDGELRRATEVATQEAALGASVRFLGFLEDLESFWRSVDVFFLPSAFEAMGTVLLDAMARGIPIVATRIGGIPEIVRHDQEGLLAPPGDAAALADALVELRRNPELARRLGDAGRTRAREFDARRTAERTRALYDSLASGVAA